MKPLKQYTFIDLFAGCGGLSEGFLQTGRFKALAHVEWEMPMVETLRKRLVQKWDHSEEDAKNRVVCFDIQHTEELIKGNWSEELVKEYSSNNGELVVNKGLDGIINGETVDLIIGGPPCQAYSIAGRAQDPNSMRDDYRNYLFESYAKIVDYYKPKVFVFENVPGMLSACPKDRYVKDIIYEDFEKIGYRIKSPEKLAEAIYCASDFDTPQKRNRVIIFGVRKDLDLSVDELYQNFSSLKKNNHLTVKDAIGSFPKFKPLEEAIKEGKKNVSHRLVGNKHMLQHEARYHNKCDINIFHEWIGNDMNHKPMQERLDYYNNLKGKHSNHVKYRSLEWDKPSPTIVAHLYKDGLMFIHPDIEQLRSITIREAAALQTFPNDFCFYGSTAYAFKMIGNAVPVQFAKNIATAVIKTFEEKNY